MIIFTCYLTINVNYHKEYISITSRRLLVMKHLQKLLYISGILYGLIQGKLSTTGYCSRQPQLIFRKTCLSHFSSLGSTSLLSIQALHSFKTVDRLTVVQFTCSDFYLIEYFFRFQSSIWITITSFSIFSNLFSQCVRFLRTSKTHLYKKYLVISKVIFLVFICSLCPTWSLVHTSQNVLVLRANKVNYVLLVIWSWLFRLFFVRLQIFDLCLLLSSALSANCLYYYIPVDSTMDISNSFVYAVLYCKLFHLYNYFNTAQFFT